MSQPQNTSAFSDMRTLMDKALGSEAGIEVIVPTQAIAIRMRFSLYNVRKQERKALASQGVDCPYDALTVSIDEQPDGQWRVQILKGAFNLYGAGIIVRDALTKKEVL